VVICSDVKHRVPVDVESVVFQYTPLLNFRLSKIGRHIKTNRQIHPTGSQHKTRASAADATRVTLHERSNLRVKFGLTFGHDLLNQQFNEMLELFNPYFFQAHPE
jgi:hypothetical protein